MAELLDYLKRMKEDNASDLFIIAGGKICEKVEESLCPISEEKVFPAETERLIRQFYSLANRPEDRLQAGEDDFAISIPHLARFRVNIYRQRGSLAAVARLVNFDIPDWQQYHIHPDVMKLAEVEHGMVLVTGTAGSGKSTTLACIIDRINKTRNCHIITLEDPIEFLHRNDKSIISQREIGTDTSNYLTALRACLRQAPDVILLGEMRDQETIRAAITAAETGHMVIATMHTLGAAQSINRIVDVFPGDHQQDQIRTQLSMVLDTVVSQQLLPTVDDKLVPAYEIMHMTTAIANRIRKNELAQIKNELRPSNGMLSMNDSIKALLQAGRITEEVANKKMLDQ